MSWLPARTVWSVVLMALGLGLLLAWGTLPLCRSVQGWLPEIPLWAVFPPLALALSFTVQNPWGRYRSGGLASLWTWPVPIAIAALYGWAQGGPPFRNVIESHEGRQLVLWYLVGVPLGEELLFRGWVRSIFHRLYPDTALTPTNPLPVAVWAGALAFSVWHVQTGNWFQVAYTLVTGLWLGYLREETGILGTPILAHAALNSAALVV